VPIERLCIYCLRRRGTTVDHVPPKSFFPKSRPSNLITVPSCTQCNSGFQKDEDYFRAVIMFSQAGVSPAGKMLWSQSVHRMYQKDRGIRKVIARSFHWTGVTTPNGIYRGKHLGIRPNWNRIQNVNEKIVKGLYSFEYGEPLDPMARLESAMFCREEDFTRNFAQLPQGTRKWNEFSYWCHRSKRNPTHSTWRFLFYETIPMLVVTR